MTSKARGQGVKVEVEGEGIWNRHQCWYYLVSVLILEPSRGSVTGAVSWRLKNSGPSGHRDTNNILQRGALGVESASLLLRGRNTCTIRRAFMGEGVIASTVAAAASVYLLVFRCWYHSRFLAKPWPSFTLQLLRIRSLLVFTTWWYCPPTFWTATWAHLPCTGQTTHA